MSIDRRKELIQTLETELNSKLITLFTGDRQGLETRIAGDCLPLISSLLSKIEDTQDRITLFLYTPGGDTIAGWGLVNLLRQYCKKLTVIIPSRALSTGTLIALGADELYLGKHSFLSAIDPSVASPYNPVAPGTNPQGPQRLLPVSVEDLAGFLDLAKTELNLSDQDSLVNVLKIISDRVHPLALGAVYRAREQSATLARKLLGFHMDDHVKINVIVDKLTKELPTHNYLIASDEAKTFIGLDLMKTNPSLETPMWQLYEQYAEWFKLTEPHSIILDIGTDQSRRVTYERAAIEMLHDETLYQHVYLVDKELLRVKVNQQGVQVDQVGERVIYQGWRPMQDGEVL